MSKEIIILRTSRIYQSSNMSGIHCSNFSFHISEILLIAPLWECDIENASLEFLPSHVSSNPQLTHSISCSTLVILKCLAELSFFFLLWTHLFASLF